jgi:hypothetical protein
MIFLDHQRMNSINDKLYDIETSLLEIDTTEEIISEGLKLWSGLYLLNIGEEMKSIVLDLYFEFFKKLNIDIKYKNILADILKQDDDELIDYLEDIEINEICKEKLLSDLRGICGHNAN